MATHESAKWEDCMKAWNYIRNDCDQETGKEYSTTVQIIVNDNRVKAIAWRSLSCKLTCCHVSDKKKHYKFAVCILYLVCSLHFVPTVLVLFLFERASSSDRNIGARKKMLVRLSWPLWLMCGLNVEELPRTSTLMKQWLLYTNWRRTQMRG